MAIITSRTSENAQITFLYDRCNSCGLCVKVCKDFSIIMENNKPVVGDHPFFGCMACGQCMAICPTKAIEVSGREMSANDRIDLSGMKDKASFEQLKNLLIGRRSIRDFKEKEVGEDLIEKIIEAAVSAPMGLPPSDVHLVIIKGKEKVREFSFDVIDYFRKIRWLFSNQLIWIWRLAGKETYQLIKSFAQPLVNFFALAKKDDANYLLYDAPLAMYFTASPYSDPADPYIPATYAMLAAESLGLGSCMIGSIHPTIQYGANKLKRKWNIPAKSPAGIVVIFGYPKYKFKSGIKRTFAKVTYFPN
ncbi:MAG: nitroreductase family protein [Bacteroidota bacterium]|nr:nitroreductase family protein [Bacteroidota bacterium]